MISPTSIHFLLEPLGYVGYYGDMRGHRAVTVIVLFVIVALPSCSPPQGEVALRVDGAGPLQVLYYPCSTHWEATEMRLFRFRGQFLGDEDDLLIASVDDLESALVREDVVVWRGRLPMPEGLGSSGRYAIEVDGPNFAGATITFRAPQLAPDRWFTSAGPRSMPGYLDLGADRCGNEEGTALAIAGLAVASVVVWAAIGFSTARANRRRSSTEVAHIPARPDLPR